MEGSGTISYWHRWFWPWLQHKCKTEEVSVRERCLSIFILMCLWRNGVDVYPRDKIKYQHLKRKLNSRVRAQRKERWKEEAGRRKRHLPLRGFSEIKVESHRARKGPPAYLGALAARKARGKSEDDRKLAASLMWRRSWWVRWRPHPGSGPGLS